MKKILFILFICIATVANAKEFRPKGYMGFVENSVIGNLTGSGVGFEFATTHGFQINPRIFVGGGLAFDVVSSDHKNKKSDAYFAMPIYTDFRFNILKHRITPFVEEKLGGVVGEFSGFYNNLSFGCDFAITERFGLYASLGWSLMTNSTDYYTYDRYGEYTTTKTEAFNTINVRVGLHF